MRKLAILFCLTGATAVAEEFEPWGEAGAWAVFVNPAVGHGCFAQRTLDNGTVVQIGAEPARDGGFFAVYNAEWTDIEDGETGILNFDFGDERFAGEAIGSVLNGMPGGYAFFDNPNFVTEFAQRNTARVWGESDRDVEISLKGTKLAIDTVLACQKEQPVPASE